MVSVIIPNYNHAPFLVQRIDSVLRQTWQDLEIIILDDCSTDDSKSIIEQYRNHEKVSHIILNETNSGSTFKQWQRGIEFAKGEWIWIAESDDWCEPILLETLLDGSKSNSSLAIAQSLVVAANGEILWSSKADYFEKNVEGLTFVQNKMLLDNFGIPNASMCIFKRSAYFNIDNEFTNYKFCGDWLFWILIALQGDVFISGKVLNYFRKHEKDVSGEAYRTGLSYWEFFDLLESLQRRQVISQGEKNELFVSKFHLFLKDDRMDIKVKNELKKRFRSLISTKFYTGVLRFETIRFLRRAGI